jgi:hypothetical protein
MWTWFFEIDNMAKIAAIKNITIRSTLDFIKGATNKSIRSLNE